MVACESPKKKFPPEGHQANVRCKTGVLAYGIKGSLAKTENHQAIQEHPPQYAHDRKGRKGRNMLLLEVECPIAVSSRRWPLRDDQILTDLYQGVAAKKTNGIEHCNARR